MTHGLGRSLQRRAVQPTPVFLPGEFHGQRSLEGYSPWGRKEPDRTERLSLSFLKMILQFFFFCLMILYLSACGCKSVNTENEKVYFLITDIWSVFLCYGHLAVKSSKGIESNVCMHYSSKREIRTFKCRNIIYS